MGNPMSTIYFANKDMLPLLTDDSLFETGGEKPIEIYAPEVIVEYQDSSNVIKEVGEQFQIKVIINVMYKQIERFDYYNNPNGILNNNYVIGIDENAETKPYNNEENMVMNYQWYKDGVKIEGATNAIYSETAQTPGIYQYYVITNGIVLEEIQVIIVAKDIQGDDNNTDGSKDKDWIGYNKMDKKDKELI